MWMRIIQSLFQCTLILWRLRKASSERRKLPKASAHELSHDIENCMEEVKCTLCIAVGILQICSGFVCYRPSQHEDAIEWPVVPLRYGNTLPVPNSMRSFFWMLFHIELNMTLTQLFCFIWNITVSSGIEKKSWFGQRWSSLFAIIGWLD